jgi:phosphoribosyl-dephospho-CoA transferase
MLPRIHDLLEIDAERFFQAHALVPEWVVQSLRRTPFVVVRRGLVSEQGVAIGIRGEHRNERWAGVCHPDLVNNILSPQELRRRAMATLRAAANPALRSLSLLAERWKDLDSPWGPGGSVGFELATGHPVVRPQSDLDVVIYAQARMTIDEARHLRDCAQGLPAAVDIRVETSTCGFSLAEYATRAPAPILLRKLSGEALGTDPWQEGDTISAGHTVGRPASTSRPAAAHLTPDGT